MGDVKLIGKGKRTCCGCHKRSWGENAVPMFALTFGGVTVCECIDCLSSTSLDIEHVAASAVAAMNRAKASANLQKQQSVADYNHAKAIERLKQEARDGKGTLVHDSFMLNALPPKDCWSLQRHVVGPYEPDKDWQRCSRCGVVLSRKEVRTEGTFVTAVGGVMTTVLADAAMIDCQKTVNIEIDEKANVEAMTDECKDCLGTGDSGKTVFTETPCKRCDGSGRVPKKVKALTDECPDCKGSGEYDNGPDNSNECHRCDASGRVTKKGHA